MNNGLYGYAKNRIPPRLISSASYAITSSYASTASYVPTSSWANNAINSNTASYVLNAISSSYSVSSSYAINALYSDTASSANSFTIRHNLILTGSLFISESAEQYYTANLLSGSTMVVNFVTQSLTSAFYKYAMHSESHARSGQIIVIWNNGNIQFNEYTSMDIGNTSLCTLTASISASNSQLNIYVPTNNWRIKILSTYL